MYIWNKYPKLKYVR